jgi:hypothetical protein
MIRNGCGPAGGSRPGPLGVRPDDPMSLSAINPPEPHGLVADRGAALVPQVFDVLQGKREPDVEHDRQADDLGAGLEVLEWVTLGHAQTLPGGCAALKPSSSDRASPSTRSIA